MDETNDIENEDVSLNDMNSLIEESKSLLKSLYKEEHSEHKIMNQDDLRSEVSNFVTNQLSTIQRQDTLRALIEQELAKKILLHELSVQELQQLYATISNEKSKNTTSLLDLFKPTQTAPNPIITPASKDENNENLDLTSEQRQSIEKLSRILGAINEPKQ